jgi:serine protease
MRQREKVSSIGRIVIVSCAALLAGTTPAVGQEPTPYVRDLTPPPREQLAVPGEIIVKLREGMGGLSEETVTAQGLERAERAVTSGGELILRLATAPAALASEPDARDVMTQTLEKARALDQLPNVEYAEPNYLMFPTLAPNDPDYGAQWHYLAPGTGPAQAPGGVGLPSAWDTNVGGAQVVVAVIDTGILPSHPDIVGSANLAGGYDMISDAWMANDGDGRDLQATDPGDAVQANECLPRFGYPNPARSDSWHGTHVAGTVGVGRTNNALGVAGTNWRVTVVPIRVLGRCGGTTVDIADAIRWAAGMAVPGVPPNPTPARVINMSLGGLGSCTAAYQNAIDDVLARNVAVVVAAGNDRIDAAGARPASCNGVITVAASDYRGHLVSRYSNFGPTVEIMAPGGDVQRDDNSDGKVDGVLSTVQGGYAWYNGTSMAAPHVAGVAALWLAKNGSLTPAQLLAELQAHVRPRDASHGCPANTCGSGLLTAAGTGTGPAPSTPVPPVLPTATPHIADTPALPIWAVIGLALVIVLSELQRRRARQAPR